MHLISPMWLDEVYSLCLCVAMTSGLLSLSKLLSFHDGTGLTYPSSEKGDNTRPVALLSILIILVTIIALVAISHQAPCTI